VVVYGRPWVREDDRRIAGVLCSMSVAHQLLDEPEKALKARQCGAYLISAAP